MRMNTSSTLLLLALLLTLNLVFACSFEQVPDEFFREDTIRVLILSGRSNHDWRQTTPFLRDILEKEKLFEVRVSEEPSGLTSAALAPYQLLVLDYMGPRWGEVTEQAVEAFVSSGKGLVVVHGASYAFGGLELLTDNHRRTGITEPAWPQYRNMIGGVWSEKDPVTAHGDNHSFKVEFVDRDHPVTKGLGEGFIATDELYHDLSMNPDAHILATAFSAAETRGTGEDEPILWTVAYGSGRVFHTTLGHDLVAMTEPGFISTFTRGCEWAATGAVTLPASLNVTEGAKDLVRTLVVTGGHDYQTEFYTLFDRDWLSWEHSPANCEAFKNDIRGEFDVLLLYDLSEKLDERGKENLRSFVESGKGLVVMHHALADYNSWEWWWRDVVGGSYILGEGQEASTYKHDVELFIKKAEEHPVTRGLGAMHFWDETYKNMWISPEVTVLLEVKEESSDGPVSWVSPYSKSRVICIQLGHDRNAFLNPGFRTLVKRAVLWAGRKLE